MKCPKCEKPVFSVTVTPIDGNVPFGTAWKCVAYSCVSCQSVLSVQIDPIAIKTDILNGVAKLLGRG